MEDKPLLADAFAIRSVAGWILAGAGAGSSSIIVAWLHGLNSQPADWQPFSDAMTHGALLWATIAMLLAILVRVPHESAARSMIQFAALSVLLVSLLFLVAMVTSNPTVPTAAKESFGPFIVTTALGSWAAALEIRWLRNTLLSPEPK
ncbi:MAG: hypothetical protein ACYDAY_02845 [Candidatus Dormibacteria bacterium]